MASPEELDRRFADVPETAWPLFIRDWRLKRGDHATILGPTDCGKTTVALQLLAPVEKVVLIATKPRDPFYPELVRRGWTRVTRWPKSYRPDPKGRVRILLHVPTATPSDVPKARKVLAEALERIARAGDITVYLDELMFAMSPEGLRLGPHLKMGWQQWRTSKISIVSASQRPRWVPEEAFGQVKHIFTAVTNDLGEAERIGEMASLDRFLVRDRVRTLEPFQFLHIETRAGGQRRLELLRPPKLI